MIEKMIAARIAAVQLTDPAWVKWANSWLSGADRTAHAAEQISSVMYDARLASLASYDRPRAKEYNSAEIISSAAWALADGDTKAVKALLLIP